MKMEDRFCKFGNYIFYVALMLETIFVLLDKSNYIIQHETWLFRLTFVIFGIKILLTKYTKKEWIMIAATGIVGIISWMATDREEIIRIVALVAACKGINRTKMVKIVFYETLIGSLVIVLLAITGIYGVVTVTGYFRGGGIEETRYCLGMGHPNAFHCMFLMVMTLGLALYREKLNWLGYAVVLLFNLAIYKLTDSRTSLLIATGTIGLSAFLHYAKQLRDKKLLYKLGIAFILICTVFSIFIAIVGVDIPLLRQIDIRINGRFQWAKSDGGIQFWSLFSQEENQNFFDMGYVRLFYWYGVIPAVLYLVVLCITVWRCWQEKAYDAFLVIMVFAAYSLIEAHAVSTYIGRNYVLLYMGTLLLQDIDSAKGIYELPAQILRKNHK